MHKTHDGINSNKMNEPFQGSKSQKAGTLVHSSLVYNEAKSDPAFNNLLGNKQHLTQSDSEQMTLNLPVQEKQV